jgi:CHAD domain-containing protein
MALAAAFSVCLDDPTPEAVHRLRSETRRIEAQLELLFLIPRFPAPRAKAQRVNKRMKKLRQVAGQVRDLDVQRKLINEVQSAGRAATNDNQTLRDAKAMRRVRKHLRSEGAQKLLRLIRRRGPKISAALEDILLSLEPRQDFQISPEELLTFVDRGFRREPALSASRPSDDELHAIRKAAKRARYQAENDKESKIAKVAAKRYEDIQEHGGKWHDWLGLAQAVNEELGQHHKMAALCTALRDKHLLMYRDQLAKLRRSTGFKVANGRVRQPIGR